MPLVFYRPTPKSLEVVVWIGKLLKGAWVKDSGDDVFYAADITNLGLASETTTLNTAKSQKDPISTRTTSILMVVVNVAGSGLYSKSIGIT